jgi:hypothetical protein
MSKLTLEEIEGQLGVSMKVLTELRAEVYRERTKGKRDSMPRGPERWQRAALNAVRRPNSKGARLYLSRTLLAFQVTEAVRADNSGVSPRQMYSHNRLKWVGGVNTQELAVNYYTCSVYCTMMQLQLDHSVWTLQGAQKIFAGKLKRWDRETHEWVDSEHPFVTAVFPKTLKRNVRCQVCGSAMRKAR